ncbi:MAG: tetratricopeptide repeat protein [Acidobacteria bacterium]|nr:tetratricopeptide repeat protein [Acidobacteriota bacterium]
MKRQFFDRFHRVVLLLAAVLAAAFPEAFARSAAAASDPPPNPPGPVAPGAVPAPGKPDPVAAADGLAGEARDLLKRSRLREAAEKFLAAAEGYRIPEPRRSAECLEKAGRAFLASAEKERALDAFEKALVIWREAGDRAGEARALRRAAEAKRASGMPEAALALIDQALAVSREAGDRSGEAQALCDRAEVFYFRGDRSQALALLEEALPLWRAAGDKAGEARTLGNVANIWNRIGEREKALARFRELLPLYRSLGDRSSEAATLMNLGLVLRAQGDYREALEKTRESLSIFRELNDRGAEAMALNNLGVIQDFLGDRREALACHRQALEIRRATGDRDNEAISLVNLGCILAETGDEAGNRENLEQALRIHRERSNRHGEGSVLYNLGMSRGREGDFSGALEWMGQALDVRKGIHDVPGQAQTLQGCGQMHMLSGRTEIALGYLVRALVLEIATGNRPGEALALERLARAWKKLSNPRMAAYFGKKAVNVVGDLRGRLEGLDRDTRKSFARNQENVYRFLAALLLSGGRLAEAQQVLDLMKEEEHLEFLGKAGRKAGDPGPVRKADLTPDETVVDRLWSEALAGVVPLLHEETLLAVRKNRSAEQEKRLRELESGRPAREEALLAACKSLAGKLSPPAGPGEKRFKPSGTERLREDLRRLGAGAMAVYVLVTEGNCWALAVTPATREVTVSPVGARELDVKVRMFREALQRLDRDPRKAAEGMYRILAAQLEPCFRKTRARLVLWSLDRALRYLPVAALHDGRRYLVERFCNVVYTPAVRESLIDERAGRRVLGLGVTRAHGDLPALEGVVDELGGIVRVEGDASSPGVLPGIVRLDQSFTRETLLQAGREGFQLLHVASHFQFGPGDEENSYLLLGDGGRLTLADLKGLEDVFDGVELLVLSACNTAMGGEGAYGQEIEGFGALARQLGARAVLASLWPVEDVSTAVLMREFYRIWATAPDWGKAEALRQAQLALMRGAAPGPAAFRRGVLGSAGGSGNPQTPSKAPSYAHPFFWSPFVLTGNPR